MKKARGFSWYQSVRIDSTLNMDNVSDDVNDFLAKLNATGAEDISISYNVIPTVIMANPTPISHKGWTLGTEAVIITALVTWEDNLVWENPLRRDCVP